MKKFGILNDRLSGVIAEMGHTDMLVICDAGLPIPANVERIDLAVRAGLPAFLDVVAAVATELQVEQLIVAEELEARNEPLVAAIQTNFPQAATQTVPHETFKALSQKARAVVRTGECTPYANVILCSGVTF